MRLGKIIALVLTSSLSQVIEREMGIILIFIIIDQVMLISVFGQESLQLLMKPMKKVLNQYNL